MNVMQSPRRDEGTAYESRPAKYTSGLVEVGRGTPMGELLRRYWHPVGSRRMRATRRARQKGDIGRMRSKFNGKFWWEMTEAEHQRHPGDYEAQVGQGPITIHSEEHFAQSDRGVVMIRRMLQDQLDALAAGRDPIGVSFDPNAPPVEVEAGNYIREA